MAILWSWPALAFSQTSSEDASPQTGARLGVVVPLSGPFAPVGRQVAEAARLAATEQGVELILHDSEGLPERAIEAVKALSGDPRVVAIVGPVGQRESQAAAGMAGRVGMPMFTLSSVETVNLGATTVFRARQSPAEQARGLARAARELYDLERAAVFFPANDYGRGAAIAFVETFQEKGGKVVAAHDYAPDTTNFTHPLSVLVGEKAHLGHGRGSAPLKAGKRQADRDGNVPARNQPVIDFDALFIPDFHGNVARLLPFLPGAGIQTGESPEGVALQLLGLAGWQGDRMAMTGAHAAGAIYVDVFVGRDEGGAPESFALRFEDALGRPPVDLEAETYDLVVMLSQLIKRVDASSVTGLERRIALVEQARQMKDFKGVCGGLAFGSQGEPLRPTRLFRFDVGGAVVPLVERQ